MRNGDKLCLDIDKSIADWASYNKEGTFNSDLFFDWQAFKDYDTYMKYVRDDENYGIGGNKPDNNYMRSNKFTLIIRSGV